jgi:hypothetical protein
LKRVAVVLLVCILLSGCSSGENALDTGIDLRGKLLKAETVSFCADISADHGDTLDLFSMECRIDSSGTLFFTVTSPDTIAGISGQVTGESGALTFDDTVLYFPLVDQNRLSPVSAPWAFMNAMRSGYLRSAGTEQEQIRLTFDNSYEEDALQVDVWLNENHLPRRAEVLCEGLLVLSMDVKNFEIL